MAKSQGDIQTTVGELGLGLNSSSLISQDFIDTLERFGYLSEPPFIGRVDVNMISGTSTYAYPATALRIWNALMGGYLLGKETETSLNAYNKTWTSDTDIPVVIFEDMLSRQYSLYPTPNFNSGTLLHLFYVDKKTLDIQEYYALALTLFTLERAFTHSSNNQAPELAGQAMRLGEIIMRLLGHHDIQRDSNRK